MLVFLSLQVFSQNSKPTSQSNSSLDFDNFLTGVKYAEVFTTPEQENFMINNPGSATVYKGITKYLEAMEFDEVGFSSEFEKKHHSSICDKAVVRVEYGIDGFFINNLSITFESCDGEWWQFNDKDGIIKNGLGDIPKKVYNKFKKMYGFKKPAYNKDYRRELPSQKTQWTANKLQEHWRENGIDLIEGIYEGASEENPDAQLKVGLIKENEEYLIVYLEGSTNYEDWFEGELKAKMKKTANSSIFKLEWYKGNKSVSNEPYAAFETGLIHVIWSGVERGLFFKLFPSQDDQIALSSNKKSSGTGFALSTEGLIVTNHHVVEGATKIKVRGVRGDFSRAYNAVNTIEDKKNDLAIIKIDDPDFTQLAPIPYTIDGGISDVGSTVYALGYPLRATMGDEVKLTNGIISSKTGFQGDITSYQISVPLQPGNSGGPLFDSKGNVIGIVNAKHSGAENASYAVKSSYLMNLIQVMDNLPSLSKSNIISDKDLSQQVKSIKEHVYIIEVN